MHHKNRNSLIFTIFLFSVIATLGLQSLFSSDEEKHWVAVSTGEYKGYAELYVVKEGNYIIEGDTNLGGECAFRVSSKGVDYNGEVFSWDAPGLQASRDTKEGRQRINFRGKIGNIVVADLVWEKPKGNIVSVMRMSVAQTPEEKDSAANAHGMPLR